MFFNVLWKPWTCKLLQSKQFRSSFFFLLNIQKYLLNIFDLLGQSIVCMQSVGNVNDSRGHQSQTARRILRQSKLNDLFRYPKCIKQASQRASQSNQTENVLQRKHFELRNQLFCLRFIKVTFFVPISPLCCKRMACFHTYCLYCNIDQWFENFLN